MLKKWNIIFFGLLLLFPFKTSAECDYKRLADLSKIASNVNLSYSYLIGENGEPKFFVNISNLTNDIYMVDYDNNIISGVFEKEFEYYSGSNMRFIIYSNDPNCYGEKIMTKYLKIPKFNSFFNTDECKNNPNFKYCSLWAKNDISDDAFKAELNNYLNDINTIDNKAKVNDDTSDNNYLLYIVLPSVILFIFLIVIFIKRLFIKRKHVD